MSWGLFQYSGFQDRSKFKSILKKITMLKRKYDRLAQLLKKTARFRKRGTFYLPTCLRAAQLEQ